jgi:hypothetical protein
MATKTKTKRRFNFDTHFSFENEEGEEFEFDVSANVNPYHPAKLSGPPEDCYPAEGGDCDDWQLFRDGKPISNDEFEKMGGDLDELKESIEEDAQNYEPDVPDYDPPDVWEEPDYGDD